MDTDGKLAGLLRDCEGIAIVYIALILLVLLVFVGLAIDIGYMYVAKGQLQNAADSGSLAGVSRLPRRVSTTDLTAFGNLSGARREAWRFAYKNKMVPSGRSVFLVMSSSLSSLSGNLNNSNDPAGDIVVGHWSQSSGFTPADTSTGPNKPSINAVKVKSRRTSDAPVPNVSMGDNPVDTFFGKVINMNNMSVSAEAVAALPPGATNYILMCSTFDPTTGANTGGLVCTPACSFPNQPCAITPTEITTQPNPNPPCSANPDSCKFAWTSLSKPNTPNNWLTDTVCSQVFPNEDVCAEALYTTQGQTNAVAALETAMYNPYVDTANKECGTDASGNPIQCTGSNGPVTAWWIIIPISTNTASPSSPGCPPGNQPNPFYVDHFALLRLTRACHSGGGIPSGCAHYQAPSCPGGGDHVVFDRYLCMTCAQKDLVTGLKWKLVK